MSMSAAILSLQNHRLVNEAKVKVQRMLDNERSSEPFGLRHNPENGDYQGFIQEEIARGARVSSTPPK